MCLAGKIQASVGSSRVRLGHWGVGGEKTWVCPPSCPAQRVAHSPPEMAPGLWQRAEVDAYLELAGSFPKCCHNAGPDTQ